LRGQLRYLGYYMTGRCDQTTIDKVPVANRALYMRFTGEYFVKTSAHHHARVVCDDGRVKICSGPEPFDPKEHVLRVHQFSDFCLDTCPDGS
jgi:hypothetical protein